MCERNIYWLPLAHPLLGTWPATQAHALTGNRTGDPSVHRPMLNPLSYTSQGSFLNILKEKDGFIVWYVCRSGGHLVTILSLSKLHDFRTPWLLSCIWPVKVVGCNIKIQTQPTHQSLVSLWPVFHYILPHLKNGLKIKFWYNNWVILNSS